MPRIKRQRGGQPGNRNARKHGYYSRVVISAELAGFSLASRLTGLEAEIALLRCRLRTISGSNALGSDSFLRTFTQLRLALQARKRVLSHQTTSKAI
jgi:hypothetical protein